MRVTVIAAGFDSSPSRAGYQRPPGARPAQVEETPQYRIPTTEPAARPYVPAAPQQYAPTPAQPYSSHPGHTSAATINSSRPGRIVADDDDVDVPAFMKR